MRTDPSAQSVPSARSGPRFIRVVAPPLHPTPRSRRRLPLIGLLLLPCLGAQAEITLDGSLGGPRGPLAGPEVVIPAAVGRQTGENLFHSFRVFEVLAGESATFTGVGATGPIARILSRVTGGSVSTIDGLLASSVAGADLYLLNPAGVVFGPGAQLDVQGSFHVSTADYLTLEDEGRFAVSTDPQQSILTSAPPAAFGFLGETPPGAITVEGSTTGEGVTLGVAEGETLSLVGGDIEIRNGTLTAAGGRHNVVSVASAGEVELSDTDVSVEDIDQLGRIEVTDGSISASGESGGEVFIRGGELVMKDSVVETATLGAGEAGHVSVQASALTMEDGLIQTITYGAGRGGDIEIKARTVELEGGAQISSNSSGFEVDAGQGGDITVLADEAITISGRNEDSSLSGLFASTFGNDDGGNIFIQTPLLTLQESGQIVSRSGGINPLTGKIIRGLGRAGDITVLADEAITIKGQNNYGVSSRLFTTTVGVGDAGNVLLSAPTVDMTDGGIISVASFGDGDAGNIEMNISRIKLTEGASIRVGTEGSGKGGTLRLVANESVFISGEDSFSKTGFYASSGLFLNADPSGNAGSIIIETPSLVAENGSRINAGVWGDLATSKAGSITLNVEKLQLSGGSQIANSSRGIGEERGGNLTISAKEILISGIDGDGFRSGMFSDALGSANSGSINISAGIFSIDGGRITSDTTGKGNAGDIKIDVGYLELTDEAQIFSGTEGTGNGSRLTINAETIFIKGTDRDLNADSTGLFTNVKDIGSGTGGDIEILANQLKMSNGADISAETRGQGRAGNITMKITDEFISDNSRIETAVALPIGSSSLPANAATVGGDIFLQSNKIYLNNNSEILAQSQRGPGNAGNITLQGSEVLLDQQATISTEALEAAGGGNITIAADTLQLTRESPISASVGSGEGSGGNVTLSAETLVALENSDITAQADQGFGGNITITADVFLRSPDVDLNVSSQRIGNDGDVQINTPDLDIAGSITNLPTTFLDAASRLSDRCAARTADSVSSFVVTGAGGIPPGPDKASLSGYRSTFTNASQNSSRLPADDAGTSPVLRLPALALFECGK